jgi:hypothetical protein
VHVNHADARHARISERWEPFLIKLHSAFIALRRRTILRCTLPWTTVMGHGYISLGL